MMCCTQGYYATIFTPTIYTLFTIHRLLHLSSYIYLGYPIKDTTSSTLTDTFLSTPSSSLLTPTNNTGPGHGTGLSLPTSSSAADLNLTAISDVDQTDTNALGFNVFRRLLTAISDVAALGFMFKGFARLVYRMCSCMYAYVYLLVYI